MPEKEELELLDLDDDAELPDLPVDNPLECARPRRPYLLFGIAAIVIALATFIIIRVIGSKSEDAIDIQIDVPAAVVTTPAAESGTPVAPESDSGAPVRIVTDRVDAKFNPAAEGAAPKVEAPKPRPVTKTDTAKPAVKAPVSKPAATAVTTGWSVQVGSYSTRDGALAAQKRLQTTNKSLFGDRQFVVLAAVLPNGSTTYRLRVIGFENSADANGFCRNAKSDGVDCYVAK